MVSTPTYKAVLFDFDGTLFDSEEAHYKALSKTLKKYGESLSFEEYVDQHVGVSIPDSAKILVKKYCLDISSAEIAKEREQEYYIWLEKDVPIIFPYSQKLIQELKEKGLILGLVTGSGRVGVIKTLEYYNLIDTAFEVILTREDFSNSKPDPEPYIKAITKINVPQHQCLVIEDSFNGVESAKGAGLDCICVNHSPAHHKVECCQTFQNFQEVHTWLKSRI